MKKIFSIFAALAVLTTSIIFTACDTSGLSDILAPEDTWYSLPIKDNNGVEIGRMAFIYSDDGIEIPKASDSDNLAISIEPGITIIVWAEGTVSKGSNTILDGFAEKTYLMKTFPKEEAIQDYDNKSVTYEGKAFKGTRTTWGTMFTATKIHNADITFKSPKAPRPINKGNTRSYTAVDDTISEFLESGFSWKNVLKQILISTL